MWLTSKNEKKKKKAVALEHYGPALSVSRVQSPLERSSSSSDSLLSFPVVLDSLSLNSLCLFNTTVHYQSLTIPISYSQESLSTLPRLVLLMEWQQVHRYLGRYHPSRWQRLQHVAEEHGSKNLSNLQTADALNYKNKVICPSI